MTVTGNLFVISAPSGAGKTSLVKSLIESMQDITVSISHTTRAIRPGEIDGVNYHFVSEQTFAEMIKQGDFLEFATVFHRHYGTSHTWVENTLAKGLDVILEIDWQGCQQIQQKFPDCISIFILPPSLADLEARLKNRDQDKAETIQERLADTHETVSHLYEFDYIVVNDNFERALLDLKTIVLAGRLQESSQAKRYAKLIHDLSTATP